MYATFLTMEITQKGPIYRGPNFPLFLKRITPIQSDTFSKGCRGLGTPTQIDVCQHNPFVDSDLSAASV